MSTAAYIDCLQGSAEWFQMRIGCLTSSRIGDAIAKLKRKDGEAACRRNLRLELVCERLTNKASDHYVSQWMEEGTEKEPLARAEYEMKRGVYVEQVGFCCHPTIKLAGASPDGLVGTDGLIEIKCPKTETHLQYLIDDVIPEAYLPQMLWQMACAERQWNDFVSFHPDLPEPLQLFIKRLPRSKEAEATIQAMELEAVQFLGEVDQVLEQLKQRNRTEVGA